jgi:4a-hydroxytetrahydrobiopterin dehydratase
MGFPELKDIDRDAVSSMLQTLGRVCEEVVVVTEKTELCDLRCVPCRGDVPQVTGQEKQALLPSISDWRVLDRGKMEQLERRFKFKDFAMALAFTNGVGKLAEEEDHHPQLTTGWGYVTVRWWTHKIGGLHQNDFIMAARTDKLYNDVFLTP